MKNTVVIVAFFAILALAVIGCLSIFDVMSADASIELLLKVEAAILLLGGCAILLAFVLKRGAR